jgi:zinc transport system ATP-binding protein
MLKCSCENDPVCTCPEAMVCIKNLSFAYGEEPVLEDVTFCIDEGIFLGVIGPNGGGKTTLVKLIVGLLTPRNGRVEVFGVPPSDLHRRRSLIGYVPQHNIVDWNFPASALDAVLMGAYGKIGLARRLDTATRQKARELLELVGLADFAHKPIGKLSGGQQQRAFIARALISNPKLLILDEPLAGIDTAGQATLFGFLHELKTRFQLTMILVSHDVGQLAHFADQIACLNHKIHWHDRSELIDEKVLGKVYACEFDTFITQHKEHIEEFHRKPKQT